jgi:hypothetical protein
LIPVSVIKPKSNETKVPALELASAVIYIVTACYYAGVACKKWSARYQLTAVEFGHRGGLGIVGTVKASKTGVRQAANAKISASTITVRAAKKQIMPETKGVTWLIQLEADAFVLITSKEFADWSAVMDRRFGRIRTGEYAGRARRRIS